MCVCIMVTEKLQTASKISREIRTSMNHRSSAGITSRVCIIHGFSRASAARRRARGEFLIAPTRDSRGNLNADAIETGSSQHLD